MPSRAKRIKWPASERDIIVCGADDDAAEPEHTAICCSAPVVEAAALVRFLVIDTNTAIAALPG